jgi:hypothetical protein
LGITGCELTSCTATLSQPTSAMKARSSPLIASSTGPPAMPGGSSALVSIFIYIFIVFGDVGIERGGGTEESRNALHEGDPGRPCETPGGGCREVDRRPCHWRAVP